jgi:C-terminal processing protease CtpA/Prc
MCPRWPRRFLPVVLLVLVGSSVGLRAFDKADRERARDMVDSIRNVIKGSYYDPHYQGIDIDQHFAAVKTQLETADSFGQAFALIAQSLLDFGDSHTFFLPPTIATTFEYGWRMQAIGDRCYIVAVNPASDAAEKGLRPGDQLLKIQLTTPTRATMWRTKYLFYSLYPQPSVKMVVRSPAGEQRELVVAAKMASRPRVFELRPEHLNHPITLYGAEPRVERESVRIREVAIWKLPTFEFPAGDVDRLVDGATRNARSLVLDLRGNAGGYIETLERVAGRLFTRKVTLAQRAGRHALPPIVAHPKKPFTGPLVVIVDSDTSSAAEILARAIQLEGRGVVIGDRSAGRVMQSHVVPLPLTGRGAITIFYVSVTDADVIMGDGKTLEHVGVTPNEILLPRPEDFATGRDPVLARAAEVAGLALDATSAGAMFPIEWK